MTKIPWPALAVVLPLTLCFPNPLSAAEASSPLAEDVRKAEVVVAGTVESATVRGGFELFELRVNEVVSGVVHAPRLYIVAAGGTVEGREGLRRRLSTETYYRTGESVIVLLTSVLPAHLRRAGAEGQGYYYTVRKLVARSPAEQAHYLEAIRKLPE